jgi:hypothetical protein
MFAMFFHRAVIAVALSFAACLMSFANPLPAPQGDPVLWVSGNISQSNTSDGVVFDQQMLAALEQGTIETSNHVVDGIVEYKGPKLLAVLEYAGAKGKTIKVIAWDDYIVTIPISDAEKYGLLLATHEAGQRMTIDGKGPLFVVYPFAEHPELRNDYYYSLSVWQVKEIVVE